MPEITVGMPAFNATAHLREAMESVLAQTFADFELLVVDDGSTDGTAALAASLNDPRIRVERLPRNLGRATARNMIFSKVGRSTKVWLKVKAGPR